MNSSLGQAQLGSFTLGAIDQTDPTIGSFTGLAAPVSSCIVGGSFVGTAGALLSIASIDVNPKFSLARNSLAADNPGTASYTEVALSGLSESIALSSAASNYGAYRRGQVVHLEAGASAFLHPKFTIGLPNYLPTDASVETAWTGQYFLAVGTTSATLTDTAMSGLSRSLALATTDISRTEMAAPSLKKLAIGGRYTGGLQSTETTAVGFPFIASPSFFGTFSAAAVERHHRQPQSRVFRPQSYQTVLEDSITWSGDSSFAAAGAVYRYGSLDLSSSTEWAAAAIQVEGESLDLVSQSWMALLAQTVYQSSLDTTGWTGAWYTGLPYLYLPNSLTLSGDSVAQLAASLLHLASLRLLEDSDFDASGFITHHTPFQALGQSLASFFFSYVAPIVRASSSTVPRSWLLQELLNYFDDTDRRVREVEHTLDAQLLNPVANAIEQHQMRFSREMRARSMTRVPLNLDNRGVYYKAYIPLDFPLAEDSNGDLLAPADVRGRIAGTHQTVGLRQYDDMAPVPSRILAAKQDVVPLSNPIAFTIEGSGQIPRESSPGVLPFPNRLLLEAAGLNETTGPIRISIEGVTYPAPSPLENQAPRVEDLIVSDNGVVATENAWSVVTRVLVQNLPDGATVTGHLSAMTLDRVPDPERPFVHPAWRDQRFPRFWSISGNLLEESYIRNRYCNYESAGSYLVNPGLDTLALEPNTYGLWASQGTTLYYIDRRPLMPEKLDKTGMMQEPLYSLRVAYSGLKNGIRNVQLLPMANGGAESLVEHRILVEIPGSQADAIWALTPKGELAPLTLSAGWRKGAPQELTFPVDETGTYVFTLETRDTAGNITEDVQPYLSAAFTPLATFDLSAVVPRIRGLAFDSRDRLWIWTGTNMIPFEIHYDSYVFDGATRALYTTDPYEEIQINQ